MSAGAYTETGRHKTVPYDDGGRHITPSAILPDRMHAQLRDDGGRQTELSVISLIPRTDRL